MKKKNQKNQKKTSSFVVLRLRHAAIIAVMLAAGVLLPLTAVTKQVYLTNSSIEHKRLVDSLETLRQDSERLRLTAEGLSDLKRIESVSRKLGLDYPESDRIVVVRPKDGKPTLAQWEFLAILKRSFRKDKS